MEARCFQGSSTSVPRGESDSCVESKVAGSVQVLSFGSIFACTAFLVVLVHHERGERLILLCHAI